MKKYISVILITILSIVMLFTSVSYASFADFSEEDAKQKEQEIIKNQPNYDDSKSSNNYLSKLEVSGYTFEETFEKEKVEYRVKGDVTAEKITIKAEAEDLEAKIEGTGDFELGSGENDFDISVTAQNGQIRRYTIKVVKKVTNSELKLTKLVLKNAASKDVIDLQPSFSSTSYVYNVTVPNYVEDLLLTYEAVDNTDITVEGSTKLVVGMNTITIKVVSKEDSKSFTTYKVRVTRQTAETTAKEDSQNKDTMLVIGAIVVACLVIWTFAFKKKSKRRKKKHHRE